MTALTLKIPEYLSQELNQRHISIEFIQSFIIRALEMWLNRDQWQTQFKNLLARVHSQTAIYSSAEIENDITLAAQEARQLRHDRRFA